MPAHEIKKIHRTGKCLKLRLILKITIDLPGLHLISREHATEKTVAMVTSLNYTNWDGCYSDETTFNMWN